MTFEVPYWAYYMFYVESISFSRELFKALDSKNSSRVSPDTLWDSVSSCIFFQKCCYLVSLILSVSGVLKNFACCHPVKWSIETICYLFASLATWNGTAKSIAISWSISMHFGNFPIWFCLRGGFYDFTGYLTLLAGFCNSDHLAVKAWPPDVSDVGDCV